MSVPTAPPRCARCPCTDAARFYIVRDNRRGTVRWSGYCRECFAASQRERYAASATERARRNRGQRRSLDAARRKGQRQGRRRKGIDPEYAAILDADPCSYCGHRSGCADHIESDEPGDWTNLTASCRRCNGSKGGKPLLLWLATRGGVPTA